MKTLQRCSYPWMRFSFSRFAHLHFKLLIEWKNIIGRDFCAQTHLLRVSFPPGKRREGRLFIEVSSAHVATLSYCIENLLDKVNSFYGYPAFHAISFIQRPSRLLRKKITPSQMNISIPNELIKKALESLGSTLLHL